MNKRYFDWIWHVRDSVEVPAGLSNDEAMSRLEPLFHERGTTYERVGNTLTFGKKGQPAQDKMSVYDHGELRVETDAAGSRLNYHLISKAFLYCFLAPLLFVALAQGITLIGVLEKASADASADASKKDEKKEDEAKELPQSAIDKFLGAPAPEMPGKDKKEEGEEEENKGPSPTPAYVFAGIFCILYIAGRILESKLVKRLFRRRLNGIVDDLVEPGQTPPAAPAAS